MRKAVARSAAGSGTAPSATSRGTGRLIIAMMARGQGSTGVHTHVREVRRYVEGLGEPAELVTPHSWAAGSVARRFALLLLFGVGFVLEPVSGSAHVWWHQTSHEFFLRRTLRERLRDEGPCTVYAQCPESARAALQARSGGCQRVVAAVHFRVSQADEWANKGQVRRDGRLYRWIRRVEHQVVPAVDGLVFVSSWARDAVRSWMPEADRAPSVVIPNFLQDPYPASASAGSPEQEESLLQAPSGTAGDLVSVGSLETVKNHRYLLRILAAAKAAGHVYTLDIFGEGVEKANLSALAEELGVAGQLRLRGFRRDVQDRLPGFRAYVHASYSESSSLAIMEAMAVGLPVVSSRAGALAALLDDGVEGRFWPLDDAEEAARILVDLLEDPPRLAAAGKAARQRFLKEYDADAVAPLLLDFLRAPAAQRPSAADGC